MWYNDGYPVTQFFRLRGSSLGEVLLRIEQIRWPWAKGWEPAPPGELTEADQLVLLFGSTSLLTEKQDLAERRKVGSFRIGNWLDIGRRLLPTALPRLPVACILIVIILFTQLGCHNPGRDASGITLTLIDQSWADKNTQRRLNEKLALFTKQTGIRVQVLPAPEAAVEQLATWRKLLESAAEVPDVYAIDVIWPGILADNPSISGPMFRRKKLYP